MAVVFIGVGQLLHSNIEGGAITWYAAGLAAAYGVVALVNSARQGSAEHARS